MELTKEQIAMIKDMQSRGMNTSIIETITGATADQINSVINAPDKEGDQTRLSNEDWLKQADERQLTAESPLSMTDFSYDVTAPQTTRGPMGDEMWATPSEGIASVKSPHGWSIDPYADFGKYDVAKEEDENQWNMPNWDTVSKWGSGIYSALKGTVPWTLGAQALNFMGGRNRGPVINPSTQRFMQNYNVGRNQQTGRMVGGPFAGRNLPGTSMFGSTTPQQMAQNWMKKYGKMNYQTRPQQLKQQQIKNIATMNQGPAGIVPTVPTGNGASNRSPTPSSRPDRGRSRGAGQTGQISGGHHFNRGGLATLWPR